MESDIPSLECTQAGTAPSRGALGFNAQTFIFRRDFRIAIRFSDLKAETSVLIHGLTRQQKFYSRILKVIFNIQN